MTGSRDRKTIELLKPCAQGPAKSASLTLRAPYRGKLPIQFFSQSDQTVAIPSPRTTYLSTLSVGGKINYQYRSMCASMRPVSRLSYVCCPRNAGLSS